jgi:ribonuclease P protein component
MKTFKDNDFKKFKNKKGKVLFSNNLFLIISYKEVSLKENKLGLIITKKTGNAVIRNRIRRIIKNFFIKKENDFNNKSNYLIIFKKSKIQDISLFSKELNLILNKKL